MLDIVAALVPLDDHLVERDPFGLEREVELRTVVVDADRVVDVTEVGGDQTVVAAHAVHQEATLGIGACADGRSGPVDRSADERLSLRIAHLAAQVLGAKRRGGGKQRKNCNR